MLASTFLFFISVGNYVDINAAANIPCTNSLGEACTSTTNVMTSSAICEDRDMFCAELATSTNICATNHNLCPKTCGRCHNGPGTSIAPTHVNEAQETSASPPPSTTGQCLDELNTDVCEYMKPQCSFPDIIIKCRKTCGYCGKDVPQVSTAKPFTYSPGTVGHITHTVATTTRPTFGTGTGSGGATSVTSVPCSGTCCDEFDTSYCMFLRDECSVFNIADKCKNTCGLCSVPQSTGMETLPPSTSMPSSAMPEMTTGGAVVTSSGVPSTTGHAVVTPSGVPSTSAATMSLSVMTTIPPSQFPSTTMLTGSQSSVTDSVGCKDMIGPETCAFVKPQCSDVFAVQNNCKKTCGRCTASRRTVNKATREDKYDSNTNKRKTTCLDDIGNEICSYLTTQCTMPSIKLQCRSTCNACDWVESSTTTSPLPLSSKVTPVVTTQSTVSSSSPITSIKPTTALHTKVPPASQSSNMKLAGRSCDDSMPTEYCSFITEQCFSPSVAMQCRKTCNACNLQAPPSTHSTFTIPSQGAPTGHATGTHATGTSSSVTTAPMAITCNTFSDADAVVADNNHRICYYHFQRGVQYPDAKKKCESKGAHVVHIETEEEEIFLNERLQAKGHADQFWLGLEKHNGQWYWVGPNSQTPITETHWEGSDSGTNAYNTPPDHWKAGGDTMTYKIICEEQL